MKNINLRHNPGMSLALAVLLTFFGMMGVSQLRADDWGGHQRYYNQNGFYDGRHQYHHFDHYRGHRGYWNRSSGASFFINVD